MSTYTTNPNVIHETIDGETIIIDLATGTYFSLQGSGPEIWAGLAAGESPEALAARFADGGDVEAAVREFVAQLEAEGLVAASVDGSPASATAASSSGGAFAAPKLEKYTDMQDIILLDPVHQVDDARGWPHAEPQTA